MKIQTKTAILFTTLTATIILLLGSVVYILLSRFVATDFYKRLEIRAIVAAKVKLEQDETSVFAYNDIRKAHLEVLEGEREYSLLANNVDGFRKQHPDIHLPEQFYTDAVNNGTANYKIHDTYYTGVYYADNQGNFIMILSARNEQLSTTLKELRYFFTGAFFVSIIIVYTTGIFFSRQTFAPVRSIIKQVKSITAENLSVQLAEKKGKDEIAELAHTFNEMLYRLRAAFETQQNFVSNASHEFRTPITTILGETDIALTGIRTEAELRTALQTILQETEKLKHITDSLLSMAQTGYNGKRQEWADCRMDELLLEVKQQVNNINNESNVHLCLDELPDNEEDIITEGSGSLLKLALTNIVLNACKYSDNKPVDIRLTSDGKMIQVFVEDKGIGVPADEIQHLFVPFYRASNAEKYSGYGIGLPLSMNIIRLHNGTIKVLSEVNAGTRIIVELPVKK